MNYSFKTMLVLALGVGMVTFSSCTGDDDGGTVPAGKTALQCYPTKITEVSAEESVVTSYEYNTEKQLIKATAVEDGDTYVTTYDYTDGKLTSSTSDVVVSTFLYENASDYPTRINVADDGEPVYFTVITSANGNVTKVENSFYNDMGNAVLRDITTLVYTNGVLSSVVTENYNAENDSFSTELEVTDFVFDGKKNPYNSSVAFAFEDEFNPTAVIKQNIVAANIVVKVNGQEIKMPYTTVYLYNDNEFPLTRKQSVFGMITDYTYEYNCK